MNKFRLTIKLLAIAIFMFAFASMAQAQASRTWVSGVGDDANPCSRTAPCKTFAGAISKTAPCGEINVIDPGGFGAVTINKSITIDGTGTFASILAAGTTGILINTTLSTDVVTIRGISINGFCTGSHGIRILQAKTVNVEDVVIFRFSSGNGITVDDADGLNLNVRNSVIRDNTLDGINLTSSGNTVKFTLDNVRLSGNANGLHARAGSQGTARNCVFSNNTANGVFADAATGIAVARIWSSQISNNGTNGVQSGGGGGTSVVEIAQNQIDQNASGAGVQTNAGGSVETFGNNSLKGNLNNTCGGTGPACLPTGPGS